MRRRWAAEWGATEQPVSHREREEDEKKYRRLPSLCRGRLPAISLVHIASESQATPSPSSGSILRLGIVNWRRRGRRQAKRSKAKQAARTRERTDRGGTRGRRKMGGSLRQQQLLLLALLVFSAAASHQAFGVAEPIPNVNLRDSMSIIQDDIIETVNSHPDAGWTAARNPYFSNYTIAQFKRILGVKPAPQGVLRSVPTKTHSRSLNLPKEFDARSEWSHCSTIGNILDQGHCGSCWAFGAVESLQDRFCIHFNTSISLSVNDLLACCGFMCGDGCDGGYPIMAWRYLVQNGVVTEECDPYFDQVGCKHPGCEPAYDTPVCVKKCKEENQVWQENKHFSVNAYRINSDPHDIMAEVYQNGPVEVSFTVYEDFANYKSGVYKHITGGVMGGHAVKLIGWGTSDAGEDYWLLANQWNRGWGDDGYFKIIRGKNECGIEEDVTAGMPSTKNMVRNYGGAFGTAIV